MGASTLTSRLGGAFPLIQAPMAGGQAAPLAIAASNAGGPGALPGAMLAPDSLPAAIVAMPPATSRPYNVNFFRHTAPVPDGEREARWGELLTPYYRELGIDPGTIHPGPGRAPFDHDVADVLARF